MASNGLIRAFDNYKDYYETKVEGNKYSPSKI